MINPKIKARKIELIKQNLHYLHSLEEMDEQRFLMNYEKILASRHAILESIQICIDLAFHICALKKLPTPLNYREAFIILAQNNILDPNLAQKMEEWASLRNVITHIYESVDNSRLLYFIKHDLIDLEDYIEFIENLE